MNTDRFFDLAGAIVLVGALTVAVTNPGTSTVIRSLGSAFTSSLKAAMGR